MSWHEETYVYDIGVAQFAKFVRPLYPPDHPDGPVEPGPDVLALKRIAWKLGRWPSPNEQPHDDQFSAAFARGKSGGNVGDSGLAGIQRQANVAGASGNYGERSHDIAIYVRIPKGLDNAGQFAADARTIELFQEAAKKFPPKPPPQEPSGGGGRQAAMKHMEARVGFTENPANSNFDSRTNGIHKCQDVTAGGAHWLDRTAWCGSWCCYALTAAGIKPNSNLASVASIEGMAKNGQYPFRAWTTDRSKIDQGDLVVVGGYGVHVEMVRGAAQSDGSVPTYGGNTSPGTSGSQSNGGGAYKRVRSAGEIRGFALVQF